MCLALHLTLKKGFITEWIVSHLFSQRSRLSEETALKVTADIRLQRVCSVSPGESMLQRSCFPLRFQRFFWIHACSSPFHIPLEGSKWTCDFTSRVSLTICGPQFLQPIGLILPSSMLGQFNLLPCSIKMLSWGSIIHYFPSLWVKVSLATEFNGNQSKLCLIS